MAPSRERSTSSARSTSTARSKSPRDGVSGKISHLDKSRKKAAEEPASLPSRTLKVPKGNLGVKKQRSAEPVLGHKNTTDLAPERSLTRVDLWKSLADAKKLREKAIKFHQDLGGDECPEPDRPCSHFQQIWQSLSLITDTLKKPGIKELSRDDSDIVGANEHIAVCFFYLEKYSDAEDYYRRVWNARSKSKSTDNISASAVTRRGLASTICHGLEADQQAFLQRRRLKDVCSEALDLVVKNVDTKMANFQDIDLGLYFCKQLSAFGVDFRTWARLLQRRITLVPQIEGGDDNAVSLDMQVTLRKKLVEIYMTKLYDWENGALVHQTNRSKLEEYIRSLGPDNKEDRAACQKDLKSIDGDWKGYVRVYVRKRWAVVLAKVRKKARQRIKAIKRWQEAVHQVHPLPPPATASVPDQEVTCLFDASKDLENEASARWIQDFKVFRARILAPFNPEDSSRVRVTVIDTGIDESHPFLKSKGWKARGFRGAKASLYRDFVSGNNSEDGGTDVPVDKDGHGTFIAGLIYQLAPDVELSIARIGETRETMRFDKDVDKKIAQAIEHAVEVWKTDIISMSFGLTLYSSSIANAIQSATQPAKSTGSSRSRRNMPKEAIFLAAAGNGGNRQKIPYPAREKEVFKIFAAAETGYKAGISPPSSPEYSGWCFSTLGCNVESIWPAALRAKAVKDRLVVRDVNRGGEQLGTWTTMTGTSFATPIAASFVAILYQFYDSQRPHFKLREGIRFKSIKAVQAMLLGLSYDGSPQDGSCHYLDPLVTGPQSRNRWLQHTDPEEPLHRFFARQMNHIINSAY